LTLGEDSFPVLVRHNAPCRTCGLEEGRGVEGWLFLA
jgi:hypothetical protein